MHESNEPVPAVDAAPRLRWQTFGILIFYTASLLGFCGFVTLQGHSPADALHSGLTVSSPPHLPIAPLGLANAELSAPPPRTVCYQLPD